MLREFKDFLLKGNLIEIAVALASRGRQVLMSNSTAPEIAALYEDNEDAASAGLRCYRIPARRAINSNRLRRGTVDEYVITNIRGR